MTKNKYHKYESSGVAKKLDAIRGLIIYGATHKDIRDIFNINRREFKEWRTHFPEFDAAVSTNPKLINGEIFNIAIKQALGYYVDEERPYKIKTNEEINGKIHTSEDIKTVKFRKYITPNNTVAIFMLKSRLGMNDKPSAIPDNEIIVKFEGLADELSK